jgi:hypothetical protein
MIPPDVEKGNSEAVISHSFSDDNTVTLDSQRCCQTPQSSLFSVLLEYPEPDPGRPMWFGMLEFYNNENVDFFFREGSFVVEFPKYALLHIRYFEDVICDEIIDVDFHKDYDPSTVSQKMENIGRLIHAHGTFRSL